LAQTVQTGQADQQAASPVVRPTNYSVLPAPVLRDSGLLPAELQTVAQLEPTTVPAAQPAQVQLSLALHGPPAARPGRKTIVLPFRRRALPQAQPARVVRPQTVRSLPNPSGRSRSGQAMLLAQAGQNEVPDQSSSAPLRHAAMFLPVKPEFLTRTLVQFARRIFT